jgi:hypothetical protein
MAEDGGGRSDAEADAAAEPVGSIGAEGKAGAPCVPRQSRKAALEAAGELWKQRIARQKVSGLPVRAWCRREGCGEHDFYVWRLKLGLSPGRRRPRHSASSAFAQVRIVDPSPLRLRLAGGRELLLPASMPMEHVAELLLALEGGR